MVLRRVELAGSEWNPGCVMSQPVRARRLSPDEGQYLLRLVRRGKHESIRVRRALIVMASASGTTVPAIARWVAADEDTVRDVIHAFNREGLACLGPRWAGGRPRRITDADLTVIVKTATTRPRKVGLPFTHWSIRKLAGYLSGRYGRTNPRWAPARRALCESSGNDCARSCMLAASRFSAPARGRSPTTPNSKPNSTGSSRLPTGSGTGVSPSTSSGRYDPALSRHLLGRDEHPDRLRATYRRTHGIRYFHGCYSLSEDRLWGVLHEHKGGKHTTRRTQIDPAGSSGRHPDLGHPRQPLDQHHPRHPDLVPYGYRLSRSFRDSTCAQKFFGPILLACSRKAEARRSRARACPERG